MSDNPYEPPKIPNDGGTSSRPPKLDENVIEFLGIAKDDFWYYPGLVLLVIGCFLSSSPLVLAIFAVSTVFLLIFLAKSFPKYIQSSQLAPFTKVYCLLGNLALIALQIVVVGTKSWFLLQ